MYLIIENIFYSYGGINTRREKRKMVNEKWLKSYSHTDILLKKRENGK
jgi:hypothetical protein